MRQIFHGKYSIEPRQSVLVLSTMGSGLQQLEFHTVKISVGSIIFPNRERQPYMDPSMQNDPVILIFTNAKEGNVFTSVCHSVHVGGGGL